MSDFLAAVGLVLVIEGVIAAGFPNITRAAMQTAAQTSPQKMRAVGVVAAAFGVLVVWLVRG